MRLIKRLSYRSSIALLSAGLFLLAGSCSTKRNTLLTRTYHNITSRYNGYFYANESLKEGVLKITKGHKDDFTKVIPVFIYATPEEATAIKPEMNKAIEKIAKVINKHTITKKKVEVPGAVRWIDDSHLLMGKAHFYKRDFFSALESFEYVSKMYKELPSRFMARMWMIRTYDELGSISMAESIIDLLSEEKDFPKEYKAEFEAIKAYHFILRENYGGAIKNIHQAAMLTKKKKVKARYTFIMAQLHQREGDLSKASNYYSQVIKLKPEYELVFNAQINRAKCIEANSDASVKVKKELMKMLKDEKNLEYKDQLYYVLAEIAEREKDKPLMIEYLEKSIRSSISNNSQKAYSYLKLADMYFENPDYKNAQAYYDSTMSLIQKDFPNYETIKNKKESLSALVKNLNVISTEDSLQRIAKMDEKQRDAFIEKVIKQEEEEEKRREEAKQNESLQKQPITLGPAVQTPTSGQWYFYNSTTVNFGISDFTKKWGDRTNEDNWRRSNKEQVIDLSADNSASGDTTTKKTGPVAGKRNKENYLKNLPLTAEAVKKSDDKIIEAYYNLGAIYREQLNDKLHSAESFEDMLRRFEGNKYTLTVYYQLYRIYLSMNNEQKTEYYKNLIISKYPDTEYAKIISNPDYNKNKQATLNEAERMYQETYQTYAEGNYMLTIEKCNQADTALGKNPLMAKFDLLEALAIGRIKGVKEFEGALTRIIIKYPKDEIKDKAQEYLDIIKRSYKSEDSVSVKKETAPAVGIEYSTDKNAQYYWVLVNRGTTDMNKTKIAVSDLNAKYYSIDNLSTESLLLEVDKPMVAVKKFKDKESAMAYYKLIEGSPEITGPLDKSKVVKFIISEDNFMLFYKDRNIDTYLSFFEANFLK